MLRFLMRRIESHNLPIHLILSTSFCLTRTVRRSYQMDPANSREALREATLDVDEGADIILTYFAKDMARLLRG